MRILTIFILYEGTKDHSKRIDAVVWQMMQNSWILMALKMYFNATSKDYLSMYVSYGRHECIKSAPGLRPTWTRWTSRATRLPGFRRATAARRPSSVPRPSWGRSPGRGPGVNFVPSPHRSINFRTKWFDLMALNTLALAMREQGTFVKAHTYLYG
jgi:hypothetical protein